MAKIETWECKKCGETASGPSPDGVKAVARRHAKKHSRPKK